MIWVVKCFLLFHLDHKKIQVYQSHPAVMERTYQLIRSCWFNCYNNTYRRIQLWDVCTVHTSRAAEQSKVFRLVGWSQHDAVCHCLILTQQKCKGCSLLPQLQLHPPSHSWPSGALGSSYTYVSTHSEWVCVCEQVCLCGVFCMIMCRSEVTS